MSANSWGGGVSRPAKIAFFLSAPLLVCKSQKFKMANKYKIKFNFYNNSGTKAFCCSFKISHFYFCDLGRLLTIKEAISSRERFNEFVDFVHNSTKV